MTPHWKVLVLLGASGTGKSTAAAEIGRRCGVTWLQVDDLRLTLQYSRATLPERTEHLSFFEQTPDVWCRPIAELRQGFIDVAEVMAAAVRTIIRSHVVTDALMVIEGDGILPALVEDPLLLPLIRSGVISFCCVAASGREELLENMLVRGRGIDVGDTERHRAQAAANEAFGSWPVEESARRGIPVVPTQPFATLPARILEAVCWEPRSPS